MTTMRICLQRAYIPTRMRTCLSAWIHAYMPTNMLGCYMPSSMRICIHVIQHACIPTRMFMIPACLHAYQHAYMRKCYQHYICLPAGVNAYREQATYPFCLYCKQASEWKVSLQRDARRVSYIVKLAAACEIFQEPLYDTEGVVGQQWNW